MKICNNCGSENNSAAQQCLHCHMVGDFRPGQEAAPHLKAAVDPRSCLNCGEEDAGRGTACQHCRFPMPTLAKAESADHQLTIKAG